MALTADALIADPPQLHGVSIEGRLHQWTLGPEALAALDRLLEPGWKTLETGAGASTVLFALKQTEHTCVVPSPEEIDRIKSYCATHGVSTDTVKFVAEFSEDALPHLPPNPLDLVLIDGSHSFPSVFIDFHYATRRLRAGGWLFIDDTHLWTGRTLRNFLQAEEDWALDQDIHFRTAIFRKRSGNAEISNWIYQPYVVAHSAFTPWQRVMTMVREGDWRLLAEKLASRVRGALRTRSR